MCPSRPNIKPCFSRASRCRCGVRRHTARLVAENAGTLGGAHLRHVFAPAPPCRAREKTQPLASFCTHVSARSRWVCGPRIQRTVIRDAPRHRSPTRHKVAGIICLWVAESCPEHNCSEMLHWLAQRTSCCRLRSPNCKSAMTTHPYKEHTPTHVDTRLVVNCAVRPVAATLRIEQG